MLSTLDNLVDHVTVKTLLLGLAVRHMLFETELLMTHLLTMAAVELLPCVANDRQAVVPGSEVVQTLAWLDLLAPTQLAAGTGGAGVVLEVPAVGEGEQSN